MTTFDPDSRDPGLAAERTDLAWSRSGLALLGCAFAIARGVSHPPVDPADVLVGACVLGLAAFVYALDVWHNARSSARRGRASTARELLPISVGVAAVGVGAFLISLLAPT